MYASQVWISKRRLLNLQSTKSSIISFTLVPRRAMLVAKTASHLTLEDSQAARVRWDAWIWMSLRLTLSLHTCESKLNAENMSHLGFPPPKVDSSIITASYFQKKHFHQHGKEKNIELPNHFCSLWVFRNPNQPVGITPNISQSDGLLAEP